MKIKIKHYIDILLLLSPLALWILSIGLLLLLAFLMDYAGAPDTLLSWQGILFACALFNTCIILPVYAPAVSFLVFIHSILKYKKTENIKSKEDCRLVLILSGVAIIIYALIGYIFINIRVWKKMSCRWLFIYIIVKGKSFYMDFKTRRKVIGL